MSDFRLQVFYTVANLGSFTKAAEALYITQPAVTKHIRELESQWGLPLFERKGATIRLTEAGRIVRGHAENIFDAYRGLEFDLSTLKQQLSGRLRLGASTTIAQALRTTRKPGPVLTNASPDIRVSLINENSHIIEKALLEKETEISAWSKNASRNKALRYTPFLDDELVLVTSARHGLYKKTPVSLKTLTGIPLVLREKGSGTLEVFEKFLRTQGISLRQLNVRIYLGSSEGIKAYLQESGLLLHRFHQNDRLRSFLRTIARAGDRGLSPGATVVLGPPARPTGAVTGIFYAVYRLKPPPTP